MPPPFPVAELASIRLESITPEPKSSLWIAPPAEAVFCVNVLSRAQADAASVLEFAAAVSAIALRLNHDLISLAQLQSRPMSTGELLRVLKRGGRAVAAVWGQRSKCGWADIFPIVDARVQSEVCPLFFNLGTQDMLAQTFQLAGLKNIVSERLSTTLYYDSPEHACGAAFAGGPVAMAYSRFDAATRQEVHAEYLASIEPYRSGISFSSECRKSFF